LVPLLEEQDQRQLREHKAHMRLEYRVGPGKTPEAATFAARVLFIILEAQKALGFINTSAQSYQTRESLKNWLPTYKKPRERGEDNISIGKTFPFSLYWLQSVDSVYCYLGKREDRNLYRIDKEHLSISG